ncbi:acylphosphatase [Patescibacteria group bacterium]|nr:acylphosphatase [Patescibacteria group bacterium]
MQRIEVEVNGVVQGVFYRVFVKEVAVKLGLVGTVRNTSRGSVKVVAEGNKDILLKFIAKCQDGPMAAQVETLKVSWKKAQENMTEFKVVYK